MENDPSSNRWRHEFRQVAFILIVALFLYLAHLVPGLGEDQKQTACSTLFVLAGCLKGLISDSRDETK